MCQKQNQHYLLRDVKETDYSNCIANVNKFVNMYIAKIYSLRNFISE